MGSYVNNVTTLNVPLPMLTRGDHYEHIIPLIDDESGDPYDLTWCTAGGGAAGIRGEFRLGSPDGDSIGTVTWSVEGDPLNGNLRVVCQSNVTVNATGGWIYYDVERYDASSPVKKSTFMSGRFPINKDVTRL